MKTYNALSIVLGSTITIVSFIGFEYLFSLFFIEIDFNYYVLKDDISTLPNSYYMGVIIFSILSAFIAGTLPVIIGDEQLEYSFIIGIIATAFSLINNYYIPFPTWFKVASIIIFIPSCYLGGFFLKRLFMRTFIVINLFKK